jgi:hypothetical protein
LRKPRLLAALDRFVRLSLLLGACALLACKSDSQYISPRVEGRVVDAQSHQPIGNVQVRRLSSNESYRVMDPPHGGEMMEKAPAVRTAPDGGFIMDSERDFAPLSKVGWYSVNLSFQHPAYQGCMMTYTVADATNTAKGEPLVKAGDIQLIPLSK